MSFSVQVPPAHPDEDGYVDLDKWAETVYKTAATPKPDGRSKVGKAQNDLVALGKEALVGLAFEVPYKLLEGKSVAGSVSGHVNADLTGNVSANLTIFNKPKSA